MISLSCFLDGTDFETQQPVHAARESYIRTCHLVQKIRRQQLQTASLDGMGTVSLRRLLRGLPIVFILNMKELLQVYWNTLSI